MNRTLSIEASRTTCSGAARAALLGLTTLGALVGHTPSARAGDPALLPADVAQALSGSAHWASGVVAFSSQYSPTGWAAAQALGEPDTYPSYGDHNTAWASQTPDGQREFIELSFTNPLPANFLVAAETFNPGAIDSAYVWNPNAGHYDLVWTAPATQPGVGSRLWAVTFPTTA